MSVVVLVLASRKGWGNTWDIISRHHSLAQNVIRSFWENTTWIGISSAMQVSPKFASIATKDSQIRIHWDGTSLWKHFDKFHCEIPKCSYRTGYKVDYKTHLKAVHSDENKKLLENLIEKLDKLKADYQHLKYVWFYNCAENFRTK